MYDDIFLSMLKCGHATEGWSNYHTSIGKTIPPYQLPHAKNFAKDIYRKPIH